MERSSLEGIFRIYTPPPRYRRRISVFRKSTVSGSKNHANDHSRAKVRAGQEESSSGPPERTGECFPKLFRTSSDGGQTCPVSDGRKSRIPAISSITGAFSKGRKTDRQVSPERSLRRGEHERCGTVLRGKSGDPGDRILVAEIPGLPGCVVHGSMQGLALKNAQEAIFL